MIELRYIDSYQQERNQQFDDLDAILLAFSGCVTVPDHLKVTSLTEDGKNLGFHGQIGQLYHFLQRLQKENE